MKVHREPLHGGRCERRVVRRHNQRIETGVARQTGVAAHAPAAVVEAQVGDLDALPDLNLRHRGDALADAGHVGCADVEPSLGAAGEEAAKVPEVFRTLRVGGPLIFLHASQYAPIYDLFRKKATAVGTQHTKSPFPTRDQIVVLQEAKDLGKSRRRIGSAEELRAMEVLRGFLPGSRAAEATTQGPLAHIEYCRFETMPAQHHGAQGS
mmetsp:Transcript_76678/g.194574  ORF Transcript_76678/g.194574 Transcript_76678/m.194574 type:complete len:209 (+) Transcript_76678:680-1306(+)